MAFALSRTSVSRSVRGAPLGRYFRVWQERRALSRLSPTVLRDIGLTEGQARAEAARPIWDMPR